MPRFLLVALLLIGCGLPAHLCAANAPLPLHFPDQSGEAKRTDDRATNRAASHVYVSNAPRVRGPAAGWAALIAGVVAFATGSPFWFCVVVALIVGIGVTWIVSYVKERQVPAGGVAPAPAPAVSPSPDPAPAPPLAPASPSRPGLGWKHVGIGLGVLVLLYLIGVIINWGI